MSRITIFLCSLIIIACSTPSIIATKSIQQGDAMNNENNYPEAIRHYEEYLRVSPSLGMYRNVAQEAEVRRKLAHAYATQGKYNQSLQHLDKALAIDTTLAQNELEVISDLREIGIVKAYMGDYKGAITFLQRSLARNEGMEKSSKNTKRSSLADTYLSLAQVNLTLGNYKESEKYARQALDIYEKIPDAFQGKNESTLLLGIIHRDRGLQQEAVRFLTQALRDAEANQLSTSRHQQALGEVYFLMGESEQGISHKLKAIEEAERSRIVPQIIISYMRMGDAYQRLGDAVRADQYYKKAMSVRRDMGGDTLSLAPGNMLQGNAKQAYDYYASSGSTIGTALVSLRIGALQVLENDPDSAVLMFSQAKRLFESAGSQEGVAKANLELAIVLTNKQDYAGAIPLLREATRLTSQPDLRWQIKMREGIIQERMGKFDSAYWAYKRSVAIIDNMRANFSIEEFKTLFANNKVEVYDRLIGLLLQQKLESIEPQQAIQEAFILNEQSRSRTFLDMLGNKKIEAKNISDTVLLEQEQLLKLKLQQLARELYNTEDVIIQRQLNAEVEAAQTEYDLVLSKIKLNNADYQSLLNIEPPGIAQIQSTLGQQDAIVEYWVSDEKLFIWILSRSGIRSAVVPVEKRTLTRLTKGCRTAISLQDNQLTDKMLKDLYLHLIEPVREQLKPYKKLIFVPHRSLHFLPLQALKSPMNVFLINEFSVEYAPASSIYYYCKQRDRTEGRSFLALALGNLQLGSHPPLPGTQLEIDQVSDLYKGAHRKSGDSFHESFVKENAENYDYLHIATHGVFNRQQPVYSYLLMAPSEQDDGKLTVQEIFGLNINSRFVTLSACETGLGELSEGDELVGLSRAFLYAGASAVVVSLWKVEDNSTALLMNRFHQYILAGHPLSEALSLAQRDVLKKNFQRDPARKIDAIDIGKLGYDVNMQTLDRPYFWAPFILIGNGSVN